MLSMGQKRDLERTRKIILDAAFFEIFRKGFQGVSVDEIVNRTGFTKGAFYHQFPTKLDLGYALVEEIILPMIIDRWITPLEKYQNPIEGILDQLNKLIGDSSPSHLQLGCPLNNLVQEMSPIDRGFRRRLESALKFWIENLAMHLERGKANGYIDKGVNTLHAARFIVMAHEGFYGMLKGVGDRSYFESLYSSLSCYFESLAPTKKWR